MTRLGIKCMSENRSHDISMESWACVWIVYCKETCRKNEGCCIYGCPDWGTFYWCGRSEEVPRWISEGGPEKCHGQWTGLVRIGKQTPTTKFLSPNPSSPSLTNGCKDLSTSKLSLLIIFISLLTYKHCTTSSSKPPPMILLSWEPYSHSSIIYLFFANVI